MLKIIGVMLIAVSGALGAYTLNSAAKKYVAQIDALIALVVFLRRDIECFSIPIPKSLGRCPRELLNACGYYHLEMPKDMSELFEGTEFLDKGAADSFRRFCGGLGRGYSGEQLSICDGCIGELEERRRQLSAALSAKIKINSALCLGGALAAVILFL